MVDSCLAHVVRHHVGKSSNPCDTGDVNNGPLGLEQVGQDLLGDDESTPGVDVHATVVVFHAQAHRAPVDHDSGSVDQNIQACMQIKQSYFT